MTQEIEEGFSNIELNLTEQEMTDIIHIYCKKTLDAASYSLYKEVFELSGDLVQAIYQGVHNASVVNVVERALEIEQIKEK